MARAKAGTQNTAAARRARDGERDHRERCRIAPHATYGFWMPISEDDDKAYWDAVAEATELLHEERFREALSRLREVIVKRTPQNPYAFYFLGIASLRGRRARACARRVSRVPSRRARAPRRARRAEPRAPSARRREGSHQRRNGRALAVTGRRRSASRGGPRVPRARRRRGGAEISRSVPRDEARARGGASRCARSWPSSRQKTKKRSRATRK